MRRLSRFGVLAVERLRKDADLTSRLLGGRRMARSPGTVFRRQEHGTRREHDGGIVENPIIVELHEPVNSLRHKGMVLFGEHEVVGHSNRDGLGEDDGMDEKGVQAAVAAHVKVDVDAAIVVQDEIADSVGSLDRVGVSVERIEEPAVVLSDEFASTLVCPQNVLAGAARIRDWRKTRERRKHALVRHHVPASLGDVDPLVREGLGLPCLVDYAWNTF